MWNLRNSQAPSVCDEHAGDEPFALKPRKSLWGFAKKRDPYLGVPITRAIVY